MKHRNELTVTESRRLCLLILNMVVLAGVAIGAVIAVKGQNTAITETSLMHQYFTPSLSGNTVLDVFRNTFVSSVIYLAIVFILGFFSLGQPLGIALLVHRGIGIGMSAAMMYINSGIEAIPAVLLLFLPKALVLAFIAVLSVRELLKLSCIQFSFVFREKTYEEKMKRTVKLYCIKFAVLAVFVMLAAVADSVLNYIFMDLY